ncbi:DUF4142 domain-containing protein [Rudanella lutea]|uniref:DUF4142 domain-containing protein n=1 Tax=Rudanella lutea TaxID=451374 RepID=UPI000381467A|nr:DUF4142 domain-containing protein [Rudanella lutea]
MKTSQQWALSLSVLTALTLSSGAMAQQNSGMNTGGTTASTGTMVGRESKAEFDRMNKKGAADVSGVRPSSAKLSDADSKLMMEVAKGGMVQLAVSKVAAEKATNPEVRELARAEVEEQTGLAAKLKEIAAAKGVTLPTAPDSEAQAMIAQMEGTAAGTQFDMAYVRESGVNGHQKLDKVMDMVRSQASDASLKSLEMAAHPLVKNHLKVSQDILSKLGSGGSSNR